MNAPTKSDIISAGYKMTANATDATVARCAAVVRDAYLLHYVTQAEITAATSTDVIGAAWIALTFLRYMQDTEFATRTGGERKHIEWGDHLTDAQSIKAECARKLSELEDAYPRQSEVSDVCFVYFKTQLFN